MYLIEASLPNWHKSILEDCSSAASCITSAVLDRLLWNPIVSLPPSPAVLLLVDVLLVSAGIQALSHLHCQYLRNITSVPVSWRVQLCTIWHVLVTIFLYSRFGDNGWRYYRLDWQGGLFNASVSSDSGVGIAWGYFASSNYYLCSLSFLHSFFFTWPFLFLAFLFFSLVQMLDTIHSI